MTVLLFDIDNTLLNFDTAEEYALKKTFEKYNVDLTDKNLEVYSRVNKHYWLMNEQGKVTREQLFEERFTQAFKEMGVELSDDMKEINDVYLAYLAQSHDLITGAFELLSELHSEGREMHVVTNGTPTVSRPRIEDSGISSFFKEIFISEEIGANKPAKEFFDYVFNHIEDADKKKFVIIGDSLSSDILGGIKAGIKTIWYNPANLTTETIQPDITINDLSELPQVLKNI
ncbi:MAG: YjjG family noncanonical pyrimidine nucleotidase [Streptococcaceae bacterium]|nr:YjjG family noncanonical pyrimidine nucleotidase [Streptococcaceae bacterium]